MNRSGIYEILNTVNGKRYIGSATRMNKRFSTHRCQLRKGTHHSRKLQNAWNKYGEAAFKFLPILTCQKSMLLFYEQQLLDKVKPEYNVSIAAGNAMRGRGHSPETKAKIGAGRKGKQHSVTARKRISDAGKGRPVSLETRAKHATAMVGNKFAAGSKGRTGAKATPATILKLRASHLGKKASLETRAKMSAANMGKPRIPHTPEARAKISAAQKGRIRKPLTDETKRKISAANTGKKRTAKQLEQQSIAAKAYFARIRAEREAKE